MYHVININERWHFMASSPLHCNHALPCQLGMEVACNREAAAVKAAWSLKTDQWRAEADLSWLKCPSPSGTYEGFSINGVSPNGIKWIISEGKSQSKMDDENRGTPILGSPHNMVFPRGPLQIVPSGTFFNPDE